MQGDLDHPPIVIASDEDKTALALLGAVATLLLGFWETSSGASHHHIVQGWYLVGMSALAAAALGWRLFSPSRLTIGADGFVLKTLWRSRHYGWSEVGAFYLHRSAFSQSVRCDLIAPAGVTPHVHVGNGWEGAPEDVCEILNLARERWSGLRAGPALVG